VNYEGYKVDAYTRWDVRANWRSADSAWRVTAYVQNILDEAALHMWKPIGAVGSVFGTVVEPREFGIQVSWQNL
jgi:outer membrane receptor for ferrienterochelin and colicin